MIKLQPTGLETVDPSSYQSSRPLSPTLKLKSEDQTKIGSPIPSATPVVPQNLNEKGPSTSN